MRADTDRYADSMPLRAIFFDVGETLVDETEVWGGWADWLGVPRLTFFAAMGAVLARGSDGLDRTEERPVLREVLRLGRPDVEFAAAAPQRGDHEAGFTLRH